MAARLRRLKVHHFREVAPGTELHFHDGMNVLLGLNASGKTTLLELIAAVLRGDLSGLQRFHIEFVLESAEGRLEVACGVTAEWSDVPGMEAEVERDILRATGFDALGARVGAVEIGAEEGAGMAFETRGIVGSESVPDTLWSELVAHVCAAIWQADGDRPSFVAPGCRRVDESLGCFDDLHGGAGPSSASFRAIWRNGDPVTIDAHNLVAGLVATAAEQLARAALQPPVVTVNQAASPFLADLARKLDFAGCVWRATPRTQQRVGPRTIAEYAQFAFGFTREDGAYVDDAILSYGQKRMLALLYRMRAQEGPFVVDELVNGLHHAWIDLLLEELAGRQVFVSTQSPLLLDHLAFESAEEVRRTFVFCTRRRAAAEAAEALVWRGLSEDDAGAFFDAYRVGIQHVSELLRTRGLW